MGWLGMPRRYDFYPEVFRIWHVLAARWSSCIRMILMFTLTFRYYLNRN